MADTNSTLAQQRPLPSVAALQLRQLGSLFVAIGHLSDAAVNAASDNDAGDDGGLSVVAQDLADLGNHLAHVWGEDGKKQ